MEVTYTKEQQKQKHKKQQNKKTKNSNVMEVFDDAPDRYKRPRRKTTSATGRDGDLVKKALALPIPVPICKLAYIPCQGGRYQLGQRLPHTPVRVLETHQG